MSEFSPPKKRGLGRGLSALIVSTDPDGAAQMPSTAAAGGGGLRMLATESISPNPQQPRTHFADETLQELAASIREHGIIQPLIVTVNPRRADAFWIVAGERRWRAARLVGLAEVPAIVREASAQQLMEWALVENLQRDDLNPIEEATAYQALMREHGLTQSDVAERVGKSRSAVANTVRLLGLPPIVQAAVVNDDLSAGHARALLALPDGEAIERCTRVVLDKGLNVRQTEELVRRMLATAETPPPSPPPQTTDPQLASHLRRLEDRFRSSLGTRVSLNRNSDGSGRLVIHFYGDDDLQALFQLLVGSDES